MTRVIGRVLVGMTVACGVVIGATPAFAQDRASFEIGAQVPIERIGQIDATSAGIGVRGGWLRGMFGVEGELNLFPGDVPDEPTISGQRIEGLFGVTVGPRFERWRPFARARAGFLRIGEATEPVACIMIFPPPIACSLAGGATLPAFDLGGGVEAAMTDRTFARFDIGNRLIRYSGPVIDGNREARDDDFIGHDLRFAFGVGWKF